MAEALFAEGRAALERGDLETACKKLRESDRIDPQPGAKLNLARCEERRGKLATAWALYRAVVDSVPANDDRGPEAHERAEALGPRVPKLVLALAKGAPEDTRVRIGDLVVRKDGFGVALPIDPGEVVLQIEARGRGAERVVVRADEGTTRTVTVAPGPPVSEPPPVPAPLAPRPRTPEEADEGMSGQAIAGWTIGAIGLAGLLAGAGTGIAGLVRKGEGDDLCDAERQICSQEGADAHDEARTLLTATTVCWIVGGAALGTGLVLVLTDKSAPDATVGLAPFGARVRLRF